MRYFQNPNDGNKVYGFDSNVPTDVPYLNAAVSAKWVEVTASWPPPPIPPALAQQAQQKLDIVTGTRGTIIRCMAAGVAVPPAWTSYVVTLRNIANGTDKTSTSLPTQPAYPAGT